MRRVLITGASGFVGRQVVAALKSNLELELHVLSRRPPADTGVCSHVFDLLAEDVRPLLRQVRAHTLIHCAWYVEHGHFWTHPSNFAWADASVRLAEAFAAVGGKRFVGVGTMAEYDWDAAQPMSELGTALRPRSLYGESKLALLRALESMQSAGLAVAWARLFALFGEQEHAARFIPSLALGLLRGKPVRCAHEQQVRDYMDVRDAGRAICHLGTSEQTGAVNIATGQGASRLQIAVMLADLIGRPDLLQQNDVPLSGGDPPVLTGDTTRLRALGFVPQFDLRAGLAEAVAYWRARAPDLAPSTPG